MPTSSTALRAQPVIIEAALNGVTPKARNPNAPHDPEEIAASALASLEAGAAIVHNHIDPSITDPPEAAERYLQGWRPVAEARPDAVIYPTTGFVGGVTERFAHFSLLAQFAPMRMCVFDCGTVNLGGIDTDGLPGGAIDYTYTHSFADVRHVAGLCEQHRLGPSIAVFEPGFLRTVLAYVRAGRLPAGAFVKLYFGGDRDYLTGRPGGVSFGLPPTEKALDAYLEMMEGSGLVWAAAVIGGDLLETPVARLALERGGHLRVGLEDYAGERMPANEELVREAAALAADVGRPLASGEETVEILGLPPR